MSRNYKILLCFGIIAVFFGFYGFNDGKSQLVVKNKPSPVKKERKNLVSAKLADSDDMVAAILIMPKSYLPALKRFSQSAMARNIKILRAQIELKDGKMTVVQLNNNAKHRAREIKPTKNPTNKTIEVISKLPPDNEKQMLTTGFLYLLAGIQKNRLIR